jgi:capsular exopolysaccharide synthesis family protein
MTRVYEALRRAAEGQEAQTDGAVAVIQHAPAPTDFPLESPLGEFPAESKSVVQVAPVAVPSSPSSPAVESAPLTPTAAVPSPSVNIASLMPLQPAIATSGDGKPEAFDRVAVRYEGKTLLEADVAPQSREQYRRLAATLHHLQSRQGLKVVMVTSALVGEGKTLTASNLALTLSQSYQKQVLLVDADLRRPSLQAVFGIKADSGLSESLTSNEQRRVQVQQVTPRLGILPAGRPTSDPIAALTSERMKQLVNEARNTFDWIVLDTPPLALITDANLVAAIADGAVVVVKAGQTPWDVVDRTVNAVGRDRTLGIVLNHATTATQGYGYYDDYYYYYGAKGNDAQQ